jgi:hypothetical protein
MWERDNTAVFHEVEEEVTHKSVVYGLFCIIYKPALLPDN